MKWNPLLALALIAAIALAACVAGPAPESPPSHVANSPLMGNRWRLEQISLDGEPQSFAVAAPVFVEVSSSGYLQIDYMGACRRSGNYLIFFDKESTYRLSPGASTLMPCSSAATTDEGKAICVNELAANHSQEECADHLQRQGNIPDTTLGRTNSWELTDDHLNLRGEGVEMWYVMDNP